MIIRDGTANIRDSLGPDTSIRPQPRPNLDSIHGPLGNGDGGPGNLHPDPVSNPSPMGSAVNQTRPGFSAPSPSGYAGRGGLFLLGSQWVGKGVGAAK